MAGTRCNGGEADDRLDGEPKGDSKSANNRRVAEGGEFQRSEQQMSRNQKLDHRKPALLPEEILSDRLREHAQLANARLRSQLTGSILIELRPSGKKFLFDWSGDNFTLGPCDAAQADCTICLSGENLMRIARGELNPQMAMLSDKIEVSGRLSLAIYFFNLIIPPSGLGKGHGDEDGYPPAAG